MAIKGPVHVVKSGMAVKGPVHMVELDVAVKGPVVLLKVTHLPMAVLNVKQGLVPMVSWVPQQGLVPVVSDFLVPFVENISQQYLMQLRMQQPVLQLVTTPQCQH